MQYNTRTTPAIQSQPTKLTTHQHKPGVSNMWASLEKHAPVTTIIYK